MSLFSGQTWLGIDLGGTHISFIVVDDSLDVKRKLVLPNNDRSVDGILDILRKTVAKIMADFPSLVSIGMGIPGNVDPSTGYARYLPNFQWFDPVPIGPCLYETIGLPVFMRNDGRCHAIAESKLGAGRNSKVFALLTLGTGIGGALIVDGVLFDGASFDAGDFGHHVICSGNEAYDCICGKKGCFEFHASADGLVRTYHKMGGNQNITKAYDVFQALRANPTDRVLRESFSRYKDDLSTGLANLVTFYNPDTIAIGGGLSQAEEIFEGLVALVDSKSLPASRGKVKIVPAQLSVDAGVMGAAILAKMSEKN